MARRPQGRRAVAAQRGRSAAAETRRAGVESRIARVLQVETSRASIVSRSLIAGVDVAREATDRKSAVLVARRACGSGFSPPQKAIDGYIYIYTYRFEKNTQTPKAAHLALGKSVLQWASGHSGELFWAYGKIRAAARDVN